MIAYKTFAGDDLSRLTGAYGNGRYDLSALPVTLPALGGEPELCEHGYHFCRREHLIHHLEQYIAEIEIGEHIYDDDKGATCAPMTIMRLLPMWNEQTARLFAADCAAAVAHLGPPVCAETIRVARLYALGCATPDQLNAAKAAARDAAWSAARDSAKAGARDAVWYAAWSAAWSAARDSAKAGARDAVWYAARDAAWAAQSRLLWDWLEGRRTTAHVAAEMGITL